MSNRQGQSDPGGDSSLWPLPSLLDQAYLDVCLQGGVSSGRLLQMADLFEARLAEERLAMAEALEAGDLALVRTCAHRLKGSSGSLGLVKLRAQAAAVEEAARDGHPSACRSALEQVPEVGAASLQAFRERLWAHDMR